MRRWPSASRTTRHSRTTSGFPSITRLMLAAMRAPSAATSTERPAVPSAVRVASVTPTRYVAERLPGSLARSTAPHPAADRLTCGPAGEPEGHDTASSGVQWGLVGYCVARWGAMRALSAEGEDQ